MSGLNSESESESGSESGSESVSRAVKADSFLPVTAAGAGSQVGSESQSEDDASAGARRDVGCVQNRIPSPTMVSPTPPELALGEPEVGQPEAVYKCRIFSNRRFKLQTIAKLLHTRTGLHSITYFENWIRKEHCPLADNILASLDIYDPKTPRADPAYCSRQLHEKIRSELDDNAGDETQAGLGQRLFCKAVSERCAARGPLDEQNDTPGTALETLYILNRH